MPPAPLDTPIKAYHLYNLARANHLSFSALEYALRWIGTTPNTQAWRHFINNILLLLGITLLLVGIIFFFAYNWIDMNRFTKFAVLEFSILSMAIFASWRGLKHLSAQTALLASAVLLGALLAVYGQIYQTGADAFSLFLMWAILIIPWVLFSAFAPLWLVLLILLNLSLILYWKQVINPPFSGFQTNLFLLLFLLNGAALVAWEFAHRQGVSWLQKHWLGILLFSAILIALIIPTLQAIFSFDAGLRQNPLLVIAVGLYIVITILALWYYRYQRHDLLLLAICLLGVLIVITSVIGKLLPIEQEITWLILALAVIGQATLSTKWLLKIEKIWQKEVS